MLQVAISAECVEAALAAGELACPACSGRLSPWGFGRAREVWLSRDVRMLRPRRARCGGCETTHVLSPSWAVPRRRDGAEVIGEALRLAAIGVGHRRIASQLGRPEGTVRGWLRAARRHAGGLRACATRWLVVLDPEPGAVTPAGSCPGRRGRGDHARRSCLGAAVRPRRDRTMGSGGVADRRAAAAVATVPRARASGAGSSSSSCARRRRVKRRHSRRWARVRLSALDARRRRSYPPHGEGFERLNVRLRMTSFSFVPATPMLTYSSTGMFKLSGAQHWGKPNVRLDRGVGGNRCQSALPCGARRLLPTRPQHACGWTVS